MLAARSVLVVDDYADIREFLKLALEAHGYRARLAGDGDAALDAIMSESFDVILLDIHMPGMDGLEFVESYRSQPGPHARLVVMTAGYRSKQYAERAGADAYLVKPFDVDHVLTTLDGLMEVATPTA